MFGFKDTELEAFTCLCVLDRFGFGQYSSASIRLDKAPAWPSSHNPERSAHDLR